ncbi:MAG: hypothetical protein M1831_001023 [Alyxoria varia]|nr:MAG: hypothetical protein M1831_001023 [Alyxoria varia]
MSTYNDQELGEKAEWIRDYLHPKIKTGGSTAVDADSILDLQSLLLKIPADSSIKLETLRRTRLHKAIQLIASNKPPWQHKIVELCEQIIAKWAAQFGPLDRIHPDVFGYRGRLWGICKADELNYEALYYRWINDPSSKVDHSRPLEHGDLDFYPGQWWIHPLFAFYDGIIWSPHPKAGITWNEYSVYAITLTDKYKVGKDSDPNFIECFVTGKEAGSFRLLNSILPKKVSIRVLRSHTYPSKWSPRCGVRYDGLYTAVAFGVCGSVAPYDPRQDPRPGTWTFRIDLHRETEQVPMSEVLRHPTAAERDDYEEYMRVRENSKDLRLQQQLELEAMLEAEDEDTEEKVRTGEWVAVQGGVIVPRGEVRDNEALPESEALRLRMGRLDVADYDQQKKKKKSTRGEKISDNSSGRLSPKSRSRRSEETVPMEQGGKRLGFLARSSPLIELPSPGLRPVARRAKSGWTPTGGSTPMERQQGAGALGIGEDKGKGKAEGHEGWMWT